MAMANIKYEQNGEQKELYAGGYCGQPTKEFLKLNGISDSSIKIISVDVED